MTLMLFAAFLPDWNSLESVRRAHRFLEVAALVFFAFLVVFDVLAHYFSDDKNRETLFNKIGLCFFAIAVFAEFVAYPYSQRNDELSDQAMAVLQASARDADDRARAAQNRADIAESHAAEVQESVAPRRLTGNQASIIAARLSRFSGQPVVAISHTFDVESSVFAAEILAALHSGRWETDVPHFAISSTGSSIDKAPSIPGTGIFVSSSPEKGSQLAAKAVLQVLSSEGFDCRVPKRSIVTFNPIGGLSERLVVIDVEARPQGPQGDAKLRAEGR